MKRKQQKAWKARKAREARKSFVYLCPSCPHLHPVPEDLLRPCFCSVVYLTVRCPHGSILQYICPECRAFTDADRGISGSMEFNALEPLELGESGAIWDGSDHPMIH